MNIQKRDIINAMDKKNTPCAGCGRDNDQPYYISDFCKICESEKFDECGNEI
jgi:hypothetical protein